MKRGLWYLEQSQNMHGAGKFLRGEMLDTSRKHHGAKRNGLELLDLTIREPLY